MNNYLGGLYDTQKEIKKMTDYFRSSSEPVVLVLFGDHKPWLGDDSVVYSELGIDIFGSSDESFYNYYSTPYLIWANDAAKSALGSDFNGQGPDISPCYLMNQVFNISNLQGPSYLKFTNELMELLPVTHTSGTRKENGVLTREISAEANKALDKARILRYYLRKDLY